MKEYSYPVIEEIEDDEIDDISDERQDAWFEQDCLFDRQFLEGTADADDEDDSWIDM